MKMIRNGMKKWGTCIALTAIFVVLWSVIPTFDPSPEQEQPRTLAQEADLPEILPQDDVSPWEEITAALYFRMRDEVMLAREMRTLPLVADKRLEQTLIEALIEGPNPASLELTSLFNSGTRVVSVTGDGSLLTVTLSRAFLDPPAGAPSNWESDSTWRQEVLLRRRLALYSAVTAITDASTYTAVQFLVQMGVTDAGGERLEKSWLYDKVAGDPVLSPLQRDEALILTHHNTVNIILDSWMRKDFTRLYRFISSRPTEAAFLDRMMAVGRSLTKFELTPGMVSDDGQTAVVVAQLTYLEKSNPGSVQSYPVHLTRHNGLWKMDYESLLLMMEADR